MRISDWSSDVCSSDLLAAIDGRACLLCGPEAPTFGRCRNAKKSAPRNEFMSYPLESRFRKRSPRGGGTFHRYRHCRRTGLASTRSEEHTSELQSLMRISYAVFCLKKKKKKQHKSIYTVSKNTPNPR